jgi:hypothetical protein
MKRPLPTVEEAREILARKRTRPQRRAPPPVGRKLTKLVKALDERFGQGSDGLAARWKEIAGENLARVTEPVKLITPRGGGQATLEIRVNGPAAALIQHQSPQIMERANLILGAGKVGKLRIVQGPLSIRPEAALTSKPGRRRKPPLDAAAESALIAETPEGPLKAALVRLGREVLRTPSR